MSLGCVKVTGKVNDHNGSGENRNMEKEALRGGSINRAVGHINREG